jgi:hypothetical protein
VLTANQAPHRPGTAPALGLGHAIWLDANAAGWGWFVDPTPHSDSEFTTPGNQGEQRRIDLLTVLEHELGHLLGFAHSHDGVMAETLVAGVWHTPDWAGVHYLFALRARATRKRPGQPSGLRRLRQETNPRCPAVTGICFNR